MFAVLKDNVVIEPFTGHRQFFKWCREKTNIEKYRGQTLVYARYDRDIMTTIFAFIL